MTARRLKVGFVLDDSLDTTDGIQQYILALGEWLRAEGHSVHYLVGQTSRQDISQVHSVSRNVAWAFNGNRGTMPLPASRRRLRQLLAAEQFDVLHVQVPYSPFMAHRVIKLAGPKTAVIGTFHVAPHSRVMQFGTATLGVWLRRSLRRFDAMLSVSTAAQQFAQSTFKISSTVLPNVVDIDRFRTAKALVPAADVPTIIFLGRLVPRKGCQILLAALHRLQQSPQSPAFRAIICGRGPLEAELKRYVQTHGLKSVVTFTGFVPEADKPGYLRSADIAVFPSTGGESFGIVLLEAMAAGAVTLGADNSGYHTVLAPRPDQLFPINDAGQLASKLREYLTDPGKRQAAIDWQTSYVEQFAIGRVGAALVQVYQAALQARQNLP